MKKAFIVSGLILLTHVSALAASANAACTNEDKTISLSLGQASTQVKMQITNPHKNTMSSKESSDLIVMPVGTPAYKTEGEYTQLMVIMGSDRGHALDIDSEYIKGLNQNTGHITDMFTCQD